MSNVVLFHYPHLDSPYDVFVTADSYSVHIGQLWDLALTKGRGLVDHIGKARCTFFMVCSSFLYTIGGFSHICSSRPTCLSSHPAPCSLAAEIGFGSTVMMPKGSTASIGSAISSRRLRRLLTWRLSLSSPKNVRLSL